jgi:ribosomal protein S18 acetylase RimI-like enzyme
MMATRGELRQLGPEAAPRVEDVLCEAFRDYPVMRFVLGEGPAGYDERLRTLVNVFVMARALRREPFFVVEAEGGRLLGATTVSFPSGEDPPAVAELREHGWAVLGNGARQRYGQCVAAWRTLDVDRPQVHVNMIGVRRDCRGRGLSRDMLERVHALSRDTPGSEGITLTTEHAGNVALYRHLGYEVIGQAAIAPGIETWSFFRPN